jgi:hypothetical protein
MNIIDKHDLKHNAYYTGESNETFLARWNAEKDVFEYIYSSELKTIPYMDNFEIKEDRFIPLFEVPKLNTNVLKTGTLQKI